mmetsp:Transcript_4531/g.8703  ORF Transcript_4531/g.8703 Transcript_4531/m.8703 type:complete len:106 (+) Transcript_4531:816-1133(+)
MCTNAQGFKRPPLLITHEDFAFFELPKAIVTGFLGLFLGNAVSLVFLFDLGLFSKSGSSYVLSFDFLAHIYNLCHSLRSSGPFYSTLLENRLKILSLLWRPKTFS